MERFFAILLMFGLVGLGCEETGDGRIDGGEVIVDLPEGDSETENAPVTVSEWKLWIDGDTEEPHLSPEYSSLYIPPSGDGPRAIMVFEAHTDGTAEFESAVWREAARDHGLVLLSVEMNPADNSDDVAWRFPEAAARRLTRILDVASTTSGHEVLRSCPLILFGHSAASHLMTPLASILSERVAGYIAYKGGVRIRDGELYHKDLLSTNAFLEIPGLLVVAAEEPEGLRDAAIQLHGEGRADGGRMTLVIERGGSHIGAGSTHEVTLPFVESILELRVPRGESGGTSLLPTLPEESGWLGMLAFHRVLNPDDETSAEIVDSAGISDFAGFAGDRRTATWFVSEAYARIWSAYETDGVPIDPTLLIRLSDVERGMSNEVEIGPERASSAVQRCLAGDRGGAVPQRTAVKKR